MRIVAKKSTASLRSKLLKCPTGIKGFDQITEGGIPDHRVTLICGGTGTGKTLFGIDLSVKKIFRSANYYLLRKEIIIRPNCFDSSLKLINLNNCQFVQKPEASQLRAFLQFKVCPLFFPNCPKSSIPQHFVKFWNIFIEHLIGT